MLFDTRSIWFCENSELLIKFILFNFACFYIFRENIDALNAKFQDYPPNQLPAMYLEEYQELTNKLHELELKKQLLSDKLQQNETPEQTDGQITDQVTEVRLNQIIL